MLSEKVRAALNYDALIQNRDMWFDKMRDIFNGITPERPFLLKGPWVCVSMDTAYMNPEKWVTDNLEALADKIAEIKPREELYNERFMPFCIEYPIYGVHFVDKILGADVFFQDGQWYNRYLTGEIGALAIPNLDADETWRLAKRAATEFVKQGTRLPLFGTPTLSSPLNIAVNLYGQEILLAMLEEPEAARHDLRVICDVIKALHSWYINNVPQEFLQPVISWDRTQPPGYGQICGCTTQLLSAAQYAEYLAGMDDEILALYPHGGMMHLCGAHAQHIPTLRGMKNLKAVQLNDRAAWDLELYYRGLREDQVIYLNPCDGMTAERAAEVTGGNRLILVV